MTRQKTFKHRVRERMAKTGESYTAARRMLIAAGDRPESDTPTFEPPSSEDSVSKATGRSLEQWFKLLDDWDASSHTHTEIARWLQAEHGVAGWWSQNVTVAYERMRGGRAVGQTADGFSIGATKTVNVPVEQLFEAVSNDAIREAWLPGADMTLRTATAPKSARYNWEDGSTRVIAGFASMGENKSQLSIQHERLPDTDTASEMKVYWRKRVAALKELLEKAD